MREGGLVLARRWLNLSVSAALAEHIIHFLENELRVAGWEVESDEWGNIMAQRGNSTSMPLLNAHMDTCQVEKDEYSMSGIAYEPATDRFQLAGVQLGCDDKAGLAIILCLAKYTDLEFKILLTVQEECGQWGVQQIPAKFFKDVCWIFSLDRKGANDIITNYLGSDTCTEVFYGKLVQVAKEIGMELHRASGSRADTYYLAEHCPAVNLSVGYYGPHRDNDYLVVRETYNTLNLVARCLKHKVELINGR